MLKVQNTMVGGVLPNAVEHIGDLTFRMGDKFEYLKGSRGAVKTKIDNVLASLKSEYGFRKEHTENLKAAYRYWDTHKEEHIAKGYKNPLNNKRINSFDDYKVNVNNILEEYAEEHKKVPVYNRPQWLGREAAVALGKQNFEKAAKYLEQLKKIVDDEDRYRDAINTYDSTKKFRKGGAIYNLQKRVGKK